MSWHWFITYHFGCSFNSFQHSPFSLLTFKLLDLIQCDTTLEIKLKRLFGSFILTAFSTSFSISRNANRKYSKTLDLVRLVCVLHQISSKSVFLSQYPVFFQRLIFQVWAPANPYLVGGEKGKQIILKHAWKLNELKSNKQCGTSGPACLCVLPLWILLTRWWDQLLFVV